MLVNDESERMRVADTLRGIQNVTIGLSTAVMCKLRENLKQQVVGFWPRIRYA